MNKQMRLIALKERKWKMRKAILADREPAAVLIGGLLCEWQYTPWRVLPLTFGELLFQFGAGEAEEAAGDDELLDLLGAFENVEDLSRG